MELNVIDISKNGESGQEQMRARKASGEDIRLWAEVGGRSESTFPRRQAVRPVADRQRAREISGQAVQRRPAGNAERGTGEQRRAGRPQSRPVRPGDPEIYERQPVRRPKPAGMSARGARARKERLRRKKRRRRKQLTARFTVLLFLVGVIVLSGTLLIRLVTGKEETEQVVKHFQQPPEEEAVQKTDVNNGKPFITEDFLPINDYSRPGEALEAVNNIFVHYTANRGTSAAQNRSYFENLATTRETSASAHFIIGYDGEIIQCIPLDEIGYAVMGRNYDSVSIECCYLQEDGKFTEETYQSLIRLCAWLLKEYQLTPQDMRRHYDEGGKKCPLYFTEHVDEWERFKQELGRYIQEQESL